MSTSNGLQSASFDMSLYIGTQRIETFLSKEWRDVSGASQGIKDKARETALRRFELAERYRSWKPILPVRKTYDIVTVNEDKKSNLGTILGFSHHIPSRKRKAKVALPEGVEAPKKSKKQKGNEGKGKKAKASKGEVDTLTEETPKKKKPSGGGGGPRQHKSSNVPPKVRKSGVWTQYDKNPVSSKKDVVRYRVEAERLLVRGIDPATLGNLNPEYILYLVGHTFSPTGTDLADRKAARMERNARRAANKAAFGALPFKATKRALKAGEKAARATWNVVKLINRATIKALDFMIEARNKFDVNGASLVMSDDSYNKEQQEEHKGVGMDILSIAQSLGAVHLHSISNVNWDGKFENVFIAICAGNIDPNMSVNFNYPRISRSELKPSMLMTFNPIDLYPMGVFGRPDFSNEDQSMSGNCKLSYVPMRTKCSYMYKGVLASGGWIDLIAFNKELPYKDGSALQYQISYDSYYADLEYREGKFISNYKSDYGVDPLKDIPATVTSIRSQLHSAIYHGKFDNEELAKNGNNVLIKQSVVDWIANHPAYLHFGDIRLTEPAYVGYFLVVGTTNTVGTEIAKRHKKHGEAGEHIRVLCNSVHVFGVEYDLLPNLVEHTLRVSLDVDTCPHWRMPFFPWAYQQLIPNAIVPGAIEINSLPQALAPAPQVETSQPSVLGLPNVQEAEVEEEAESAEVEVVPADQVVDTDTIISQELVKYVNNKPSKIKGRYATEEELDLLVAAFVGKDWETAIAFVKQVHPNISDKKVNEDFIKANTTKLCFMMVSYYYHKLCGVDVSNGATYHTRFEMADLKRLVKAIQKVMWTSENSYTDDKIDSYLRIYEHDAENTYLMVQSQWFRFVRQGKEIQVYDSRNRVFNKTLVLSCIGNKQAEYHLCSAFDNFMRFFFIGIIPCLTFTSSNYLPRQLGDNVKVALNALVSMSQDEMDAQNGGDVHMQKISYHPVIWTSYKVSFSPFIEQNAKQLLAMYENSKKEKNTYKHSDRWVTASEYELLLWVAHHLHQELDITIHFSKKVGMDGLLSATNLGCLAKLSPTIFVDVMNNLGIEKDRWTYMQQIVALLNSSKESKLAKRLTLFLTSACTYSRTGQLVYASHRLITQTKPMQGLRYQTILASTLVGPAGMAFTVNSEPKTANIFFSKDEYILEGNYSIDPTVGHPFNFDESDIDEADCCNWIQTVDEKGWFVLTPDKELMVYGGEVICRTMPVIPLELDGRGFIRHTNDVEGVLINIKWKVEADLSAKSKLRVTYTLLRDIEQFKLRNTFVKCNTSESDPYLFFNNLNGNEDEQYPALIVTQDAAKLDVVTWVMSLVCDTVGNPENWDETNEVFMTLYSLVAAYMKRVGVEWNLYMPVVLVPIYIYAGYTNEIVAYFNEKFSKASWFVWLQSTPMANMMYKLYLPKVGNGWYLIESGDVVNTAAQAKCSHKYDTLFVIADKAVVTDTTNVLCFWLSNGNAVQVAQRCMTWQSAHGVKLTSVLAVELSSILENVGPSNTMIASLSALSKVITDKERCNKIQHAAIDSADKFNYRIAALAQMVGGGNFGLESCLYIGYDVNKPNNLSMPVTHQQSALALVGHLLQNATARRDKHFEEMCHVLKDCFIHVQYKEDKCFTIYMPALLLFSKMRSSSEQANNFVHCFYYDIFLPTIQGQVVLVASASGCHGMMDSLLRSDKFLCLFKGPNAAQGKRISTPCIPIGELWVLESNRVNSQYQNMLRMGYNLKSINSTSYADDADNIIFYVCRAPIALGSILKVRVITEKVEDGKKVQYAMPLPSDTPEEAEYWQNTPLAYHISYIQVGQSNDSIYASDVGDNDGDGIVMGTLLGLMLLDVVTEAVMLEIQMCYLGIDPYSLDNDQYIADHFAIKPWESAMAFAINMAKASKKALMSYEKYANSCATAILILVNGVGVEYRIYITCDILVQILMACARNNVAVHPQYEMLLADRPESLVLNNTQIYEYTLGGFSDEAGKLFNKYLKPMMEGKMDGLALEQSVASGNGSELEEVIKDIGADVSRIRQIARMMVITNYIYQLKGEMELSAMPFDDANPLGGLGNLLFAAHAIFEMSRNDFKGYQGALPIDEKASAKARNIDYLAMIKLFDLLSYCRHNNPKVIEDCIYLYAAERTIQVIGHEMVRTHVTGDMWPKEKLAMLNKYAGIDSPISVDPIEQSNNAEIMYIKPSQIYGHYNALVEWNQSVAEFHPQLHNSGILPVMDDMTAEQWVSLFNYISLQMNLNRLYVLTAEDEGNDGNVDNNPTEPTEPNNEVKPGPVICLNTSEGTIDLFSTEISCVQLSFSVDLDDKSFTILNQFKQQIKKQDLSIENFSLKQEEQDEALYKALGNDFDCQFKAVIASIKALQDKGCAMQYFYDTYTTSWLYYALYDLGFKFDFDCVTYWIPEPKEEKAVKPAPGPIIINEPGLFAQQGMLNYLQVEDFNSLLQAVVSTYEAGEQSSLGRHGYSYTCCGSYYWVWEPNASKYLTTQPNGSAIMPMPEELADLSVRLVNYVLGLHGDKYADLAKEYVPEVALINKYGPGHKLNNHVDKSEEHTTAPIVSFSFGASGIFFIAGKELLLDNGSVCIFWGEQRMALHGYRGNTTEGFRYNVTVRMVKKPKEEKALELNETVYYTGVGKREDVPQDIIDTINRVAIYKHKVKGHVLRSGSADGCDTYFEQAAIALQAPFISYLPHAKFKGRVGANYMHDYDPNIWAQAQSLARQILGEQHWSNLNEFGRKLQTRNIFQLLGHNLDKPSEQVICWTPEGKVVGGTGNAIRMAQHFGIPVVNLGNPAILAKIKSVLDENGIVLEAKQEAKGVNYDYYTEEFLKRLVKSDLIITIDEKGNHLSYELAGHNLSCSDLTSYDDDFGWAYFEVDSIKEEGVETDGISFVLEGNERCASMLDLMTSMVDQHGELPIQEYFNSTSLYQGQVIYKKIEPKSESESEQVAVTFNPNEDGVTHINIYSGAKTELGRLLSNFANTPISVLEGNFASIEGYWHWLKSGGVNEQLRVLYGKEALTVGRASGLAGLHTDSEEFKEKIKLALIKKLETYPNIWAALLATNLPLTHYYVFNGVVKEAGHEWIVQFIEQLRSNGQKQLEANAQIEPEQPQEPVETKSPGQVMYMEHITSDTVKANPDTYYVFGDNFERTGFGGQAKEMRGHDNTIGIATKLKPTNEPDAFLTDEHYETFKAELDCKFQVMYELMLQGHNIVFPAKGIGTGLSNLKANAPTCWQLLKSYMQSWGLPGYEEAETFEPNNVQVESSDIVQTDLTEEDCIAAILEIGKARGKRITEEKVKEIIDRLNDEQKKVLFSFFLHRKDTFLTGEGGAGKTYTTCNIRAMLDLLSYPYLHIGTTGISVMNVDGDGTINSKLGLGLGMLIEEGKGWNAQTRPRKRNELYKLSYYKKLVRECRGYLRSSWGQLITQANGMPVVLFVEEVSMLGSLLASAADEALTKENIKIQWFWSGDLCQLNPVGDYVIYKDGKLENDSDPNKAEVTVPTIFNESRFQFINLLSNMRAKDDLEWIEALRQLRLGVGIREKSLPKALRKVWNKSVKALEAGTMPTEDVIHLCATNYTAKRLNKVKIEELKQLKPQSKTIKANIQTKHGVDKHWYKNLFNPIEEEMWMCVGMRVMLRANLKKDDVLLAGNGSCGFITGFQGYNVEVMFDNGAKLIVKPQALGNGAYANLGSFTQVPLHPCYAMTITKSQGLTLPGNVIIHPYMEYPDKNNPDEIKIHGITMKNSLYVAASRCPSPENLYIWAQVPASDVVEEDGSFDYTGAYNYLLNSYVCDHDAAKFVKKYILK